MHSLETLEALNAKQVHKECREALANEDVQRVRDIAKANLDLFVQDGRVR